MVNNELFATKMGELLALFPNWNPNFEEKAVVEIWHSYFNDLTDKEFENMVDAYVENEKFNPTVGGLRQYVVKESTKTKDQIEHEKMLRENGLL